MGKAGSLAGRQAGRLCGQDQACGGLWRVHDEGVGTRSG
jgi:hypothetical protein